MHPPDWEKAKLHHESYTGVGLPVVITKGGKLLITRHSLIWHTSLF